ncbi:MAG: DnaJ domain-containing protein [Acetivibrio sp.]
MMFDPYATLGIPKGSSDDEVKRAYRNLSRRYHPDANMNNPNKEQAEEKFKEIQEAYEQVMKERSGEGTFYQNRSKGGFGFGGREESGEPIEYQAAYNYIQSGHFKEALHVLSEIQVKNGRWYYYSAMANSGMGNNIEALEHAKQATAMEPGNQQYQMLLRQLESGGQWYQQAGNTYETRGGLGGNICCKLWIANMLCNCLCGYPRIC